VIRKTFSQRGAVKLVLANNNTAHVPSILSMRVLLPELRVDRKAIPLKKENAPVLCRGVRKVLLEE
jgi:hypothetical protein